MPSINFYLKDPKASKETRIYLQTLYAGKKCKYTTNVRVLPAEWNFKKQRIKATNRSRNHKLNSLLHEIESNASDCYNNLIGSGVPFTPINFRLALDNSLNQTKSIEFFEFFEDYIKNQKELAKSTITDYNQTLSTLRLFEKEEKYKVLFSSITLEFYDKLKGFIMDNQGYSINTFGKRIKVLKTIMRASKDRELHNNADYEKRDFKVLSRTYKKPYLKLEEIDLIYKCDLNKKHDKYRDMFLLLCNLGIRISDLPQINKGNIAKIKGTNTISIKMRKTNKQVTIPINPIAMQIIEKYNYELPNVSEQILNKEIKNICKIAGLDRKFKNEKETSKLHDIVTSHDGRRSFATNCYLSGIPASQIMEITGHKTESSFLRYIQETRTPQAPEIFKVFEGIKLKKTI